MIFVPTPQEVVDKMLEMAEVRKATWSMIWAAEMTGSS